MCADQSATNGSPATENIFLGLLLDPELRVKVVRRVQLSCQLHGFTGRPIAGERLHVSLLSFPPNDEAVIRQVSTIAGGFSFPPFEITFDTALSFRNGGSAQPFVLTGDQGVKQLRAFHEALADHFALSDSGPRKRPSFTPHMTLVWDKKSVPQYALERPLSWTVRDFALIRSHVGQSRYDILGRWPLVAAT